MLDDARRNILRDMNIDVWVLRCAPGQTVPEQQKVGKENPADAARAALREQGTPTTAGRPNPVESPSLPEGPASSIGDAAPGNAAPGNAAAAADAFVVFSVALPGVVLLLDGAGSKRDIRLARDLVAAAAGEWVRKPVRRRFVWPTGADAVPGIATGEAHGSGEPASRRALRAFVDKDLQDHRAAVLLCIGDVAERLPAAWPGVRIVRLPTLASLSRDPAAKRRVWAELCNPTP